MSNKNKNKLVPRLRFPEFKDSGEWSTQIFGDLIKIIEKRAGTNKYTPMSVNGGVGLVSQIEKFGREIAGNAYKNYYVIKKGDFAYNKSATKQFPEGYIAMLTEHEEAALPNSIFTCFRIVDKNTCPKIFNHLFHANFHGPWLRKFIAVGARAHGSLQVDTKHLLDMPVVLPTIREQQKIADCLTSLDELITAEDAKLQACKDHKKGLMQKLFPAEGQTMPQWRFPEFRHNGEWVSNKMGNVYYFLSTNTYSRDNLNYDQGQVKNIHYGDIHTKFATLFDVTRENVPYINGTESLERIEAENYCIEGDLVFADASEDVEDVGKSLEIVNINNEKILSGMHTILARQRSNILVLGFGGYLFKSSLIREQIKRESQGAKVLGISSKRLSNIKVCFPSCKKEQEKIADCLTSLDELITAQAQKIEKLKEHKKGLMQQLFPVAGEVGV